MPGAEYQQFGIASIHVSTDVSEEKPDRQDQQP
jgi:hypothetical protein